MEWRELEVNGARTVKFGDKFPRPAVGAGKGANGQQRRVGGILKRGKWAWLANERTLQLISLHNGQTISNYEFAECRGYDQCAITSVEECFPENGENIFLAVCLQRSSTSGPGGGGSTLLALYSVERGCVLCCLELPFNVSSARFMGSHACRRSLLQNYDGCLAVGSLDGAIVLINLDVRRLLVEHEQQQQQQQDGHMSGISASGEQHLYATCEIVDFSVSLTEIRQQFRRCQQERHHFGLRMEVIGGDSPSAVRSITPIDVILGLAVGLDDGRLVLYDLAELQVFYFGQPTGGERGRSPLVHMDYMEPLDDPRPCLYIWSLHGSGAKHGLTAALHAVMYEKRLVDDEGFHYFETFQNCSVRLELPLETADKQSVAIACQSISRVGALGEDDANSLCAISWYSALEEKNKLLLFDLNQWYKEEMPALASAWQRCRSYLAGYTLRGGQAGGGLAAYMDPNTVTHFHSVHRYEEHFYPNALSFDFAILQLDGYRRYACEGVQHRFLNMLRTSSASIFLDVDVPFAEVLRTRLLPQFTELLPKSTFSRLAKYETLLAVALEHNCLSLLRDCARSWADGSFQSNFSQATGLCLSTLTDWMWKRATDIKTRCNQLCKGIFDYAGFPLDQREQTEMGCITRQLRLLADLMGEILVIGQKRHMPANVSGALESRQKSLRMAADYHNVLLWLISIGLLPEASPYGCSRAASSTAAAGSGEGGGGGELFAYRHDQLRRVYAEKRAQFAALADGCRQLGGKKSGSCRLLYIDAFIAFACQGDVLREHWLADGGGAAPDGLYPPISIEAMLRVLLLPDVTYDSKCAILFYFFLDLHAIIDGEQQRRQQQLQETQQQPPGQSPQLMAAAALAAQFLKFPSVFKMPAAMTKTVEAFWHLDHGHFLPAVDEFVSPLNAGLRQPPWLLELLIEALLVQRAAALALRVLEARQRDSSIVSPVLRLRTLLANELVSEAFHFVRSKRDDSLLELFYTTCLCSGRFGVIRDLALTEREGQLLQRLLQRSKTRGADNLHFVYLLQRSKYIEAVSYMDDLSTKTSAQRSSAVLGGGGAVSGVGSAHIDTPNLVLSAFNTTMTPVTQGLTDVYFRIKKRLKQKEVRGAGAPVPLSSQLIKQDANSLLGGIYQSSALSAHFATYYAAETFAGGPEEAANERRRQHDGGRERSGGDGGGDDARHMLSSHNAPFLRKPQSDTYIWDWDLSPSKAAPRSHVISYAQPFRPAEKRTRTDSDLNGSAGGDEGRRFSASAAAGGEERQRLNPATKRRRLLGEELIQELSEIMQKKQTEQKADSQRDEQQRDAADNNFLTQPPKTPRKDTVRSMTEAAAVSGGIQGILKANTPEPSELRRAGSVGRAGTPNLLQEEKNLRFRLPAEPPTLASSRREFVIASRRTFHVDDDDDNEKVDTIEVVFKRENSPPPPSQSPVVVSIRRKTFARSLSVDSADSQPPATSPHRSEPRTDDEDEEDFYSPMSSRNTSMQQVTSPIAVISTGLDSGRGSLPSNIQPTISAVGNHSVASLTASSKFLSGPQPRKPLARLSAERSEKSLTPEPLHSSQPEATTTKATQEYIIKITTAEELPDEVSEVEATSTKEVPSSVSLAEFHTAPAATGSSWKSAWQTATAIALPDDEDEDDDVEDEASLSLTGEEEFVSTAASPTPAAASASSYGLRIESVTSVVGSDVATTFTPTVFSSRVCETQSQFVVGSPPSSMQAQLAECSTIVGGLTYVESSSGVTAADDDVGAAPAGNDPAGEHEGAMGAKMAGQCDTTLGMSSYDLTALDAGSTSSLQPTTTRNLTAATTVYLSALDEAVEPTASVVSLDVVAEEDVSPAGNISITQINDHVDTLDTDNDDDDDDDEDDDEDEDSDENLYNAALGVDTHRPGYREEVIVLSSSSNGSSSRATERNPALDRVLSDDDDDDDTEASYNELDDDELDVIEDNSGEEKNADASDELNREQIDDVFGDVIDTNVSAATVSGGEQDQSVYVDLDSNSDEEAEEHTGEELEQAIKGKERQVIVVLEDVPVLEVCQPQLQTEQSIIDTVTATAATAITADVVEEEEERILRDEQASSVAAAPLLPSTVETIAPTPQLPDNELLVAVMPALTEEDRPHFPPAVIEEELRLEAAEIPATAAIALMSADMSSVLEVSENLPDELMQVDEVAAAPEVTALEVAPLEVAALEGAAPEVDAASASAEVPTDNKDDKATNKESVVDEALAATPAIELVDEPQSKQTTHKEEQITQSQDEEKPKEQTKGEAENVKVVVEDNDKLTKNVEELEPASDASYSEQAQQKADDAQRTEETAKQATSIEAVNDSIESPVEPAEVTAADTTPEKSGAATSSSTDTSPAESARSRSRRDAEKHLPIRKRTRSVTKSPEPAQRPRTPSRAASGDGTAAAGAAVGTPTTSRGGHSSLRTATVSPIMADSKQRTTMFDVSLVDAANTPRSRHTRGISVPPQTLNIAEEPSSSSAAQLTPHTRRNRRANSLQPKSLHEAATDEPPLQRPAIERDTKGAAVVAATSRGLDKLREHVAAASPLALDSPSTRTRLRLRMNSMDSELDASIASGGAGGAGSGDLSSAQQKQKPSRRISMSSNLSELQQPHTPTRLTRRNSIASQPGSTGTPMTLRSHSVLTVQQEDDTNEATAMRTTTPIPDEAATTTTGVAQTPRRRRSTAAASPTEGALAKRKRNSNTPPVQPKQEEEEEEEGEHAEDGGPSTTAGAAAYSTTRRLTRTQLAVMEKSAALAESYAAAAAGGDGHHQRRIAKRRRSSRSTQATNPDSGDESASITSHVSNASKASTLARQRQRDRIMTRSSVKDKDEEGDPNDDLASVTSSHASVEARQKRPKAAVRRSKDAGKQQSPNTTLSVIPEDEALEDEEAPAVAHEERPKRSQRSQKTANP